MRQGGVKQRYAVVRRHRCPAGVWASARHAAPSGFFYPQFRFMGSEHKLLPWLAGIFRDLEFDSALDAFDGSGSAVVPDVALAGVSLAQRLHRCQNLCGKARDLPFRVESRLTVKIVGLFAAITRLVRQYLDPLQHLWPPVFEFSF